MAPTGDKERCASRLAATTRPSRSSRKTATQRRAEILSAATREFAARGYAGADVERIAERAGVGKGTVYRHFPRKRDLFFAALDHCLLYTSPSPRD